MIVSTTDIQNNFGKYLKLAGYEEVIITKNGKKTAKLTVYTENAEEGRWLVGEGSPSYRGSGIPVTYGEYLKIIEESENRYEYMDGELFLLTSPRYPHQKALREIFLRFGQWFENHACEPLISPLDVTLYRLENKEKVSVVQPDILVICDPQNIDTAGRYQGTPTLVVEVLSDSTRSRDMVKKLDLYMESGIKEYWIINTSAAEIYIYVFANNTIETIKSFKGEDLAASAAFPGLSVELKRVFSPRRG